MLFIISFDVFLFFNFDVFNSLLETFEKIKIKDLKYFEVEPYELINPKLETGYRHALLKKPH